MRRSREHSPTRGFACRSPHRDQCVATTLGMRSPPQSSLFDLSPGRPTRIHARAAGVLQGGWSTPAKMIAKNGYSAVLFRRWNSASRFQVWLSACRASPYHRQATHAGSMLRAMSHIVLGTPGEAQEQRPRTGTPRPVVRDAYGYFGSGCFRTMRARSTHIGSRSMKRTAVKTAPSSGTEPAGYSRS